METLLKNASVSALIVVSGINANAHYLMLQQGDKNLAKLTIVVHTMGDQL